MDSFAKLKVHYGTEQKAAEVVEYSHQWVHIPSSWSGSTGGSYRTVKRYVTVLGTVETEQYGRHRVEYGKCSWNGNVVLVVKDGTSWQAVSKKPVDGCIA